MPDIFGMIMKEASEGGDAAHKIEREDGYIRETNGIGYLAEMENWQESERFAIEHAKGPVLDIGCGAGRVGTYLEGKGIMYTGIDISPLAIDVCKDRGLSDVHLMSVDDLKFDRNDFNTILLFGNNFGILGFEDKIVEMLKDFHKITTEDAIILASTRDIFATDEPRHYEHRMKNRQSGRALGHVRIRMHYREYLSEWWDLYMCTSGDMDRLASKAGWYLERTFGPSSYYVGLLRKL